MKKPFLIACFELSLLCFYFSLSLLLNSCTLEENKSYLRAVNNSFNANYEDVITNIYLCEGATNDNYVSVWNGKLRPGESTKFEIDSGKYGVKFTGTRCYDSGIEKTIDVATGYKEPVKFDNRYTVRVTFDGNGIVAREEED